MTGGQSCGRPPDDLAYEKLVGANLRRMTHDMYGMLMIALHMPDMMTPMPDMFHMMPAADVLGRADMLVDLDDLGHFRGRLGGARALRQYRRGQH